MHEVRTIVGCRQSDFSPVHKPHVKRIFKPPCVPHESDKKQTVHDRSSLFRSLIELANPTEVRAMSTDLLIIFTVHGLWIRNLWEGPNNLQISGKMQHFLCNFNPVVQKNCTSLISALQLRKLLVTGLQLLRNDSTICRSRQMTFRTSAYTNRNSEMTDCHTWSKACVDGCLDRKSHIYRSRTRM